MKVDLDKFPEEDIGTVSYFLNKHKDYIQSKKYASVYAELGYMDRTDPFLKSFFMGEITSVLYASEIDPLKYMDVVPYCFLYGCSYVSGDFIIPDNITSIGDVAFYGCNGIKSVTIPNSVTNIGRYAFRDCTDMTSITYQGTKEQWEAIDKGDFWDYNTGSYTIHCTDGDIHKYLW